MDYLIHMADGEILEHHGIKGMKWGVRRYQNKDGSLTAKGKKRYSSDENSRGIDSKTALKVGAAVVGTAAVLYLATNPKARAVAAKMAKASVDSLKKAATDPRTKEFVKSNGQKLVKGLGDSLSRTGKAMTDAALISMGGIAVDKLGKKLETGENDSEYIRNRNKVLLDASKAGIEAAVKGKSSSSSKNQSNGGGNVGKDISDALGAPSKKGIDKNSSAYQALFKDSSGNQRSADVRSTVKSLASAGYDIDQINEYLRRIENGSLKHCLLGGRRMDYLIHMADGEILEHHGIRGMKWGVRRYQNADGSLTNAGKKRYKTINDAADHAKNFVDQAKKDSEMFKKQRDSGKGYASKSDYDRWIKVTEKQIHKYEELEKKFRSVSVNDLNKENVKEAQNFLKRIYENADYTDYYYKGEWHNYQLRDD